MMSIKKCSGCLEEKSLDKFYKYKDRVDKWRSRCKQCEIKYSTIRQKSHPQSNGSRRVTNKKWRHNNPEKWIACRIRKYGLTLDDYKKLFAKNNGLCHICSKKETVQITKEAAPILAIDHCKVTKRVRGLLCMECNTGIGKFKDSRGLLLKAIRYLRTATKL